MNINGEDDASKLMAQEEVSASSVAGSVFVMCGIDLYTLKGAWPS